MSQVVDEHRSLQTGEGRVTANKGIGMWETGCEKFSRFVSSLVHSFLKVRSSVPPGQHQLATVPVTIEHGGTEGRKWIQSCETTIHSFGNIISVSLTQTLVLSFWKQDTMKVQCCWSCGYPHQSKKLMACVNISCDSSMTTALCVCFRKSKIDQDHDFFLMFHQ